MIDEELDLTPDPTPEPVPEEPSIALPPEAAAPAPPVEVISVDELLDRLTQGDPQPEESAEVEESQPLEETAQPEPTEPPVLAVTGEDGGPLVVLGMDEVLETLESIREVSAHPALTTSFADYTVTEALLLLLLLAAFLTACSHMLKGGLKWLRS